MKFKQIFLCLVLFFALSFIALPNISSATDGLWDDQVGLGKDVDSGSGNLARPFGSPEEQNRDVRVFVINVIKVFLSILGILFVALIIWGGFRWMTSAGNQDQVSEAKRTLMAGIIGFAIIMSALAIANFVSSTIEDEVLNVEAFE